MYKKVIQNILELEKSQDSGQKIGLTLNEDANALMNRIEDKFFLPASKLQEFVSLIREKLKEGDIDTFVRHNTNRTIYLDNRDLDSFKDNLEGIKPRFKVRIRQYKPNNENWENIAYLELKIKTENGMGKKTRIRIHDYMIEPICQGKEIKSDKDLELLNKDIAKTELWQRIVAINTIIEKYGFRKQTVVEYHRRAYSNSKIRISIDDSLRYYDFKPIDQQNGNSILESDKWKKINKSFKKIKNNDVLILEIKHEGKLPDWIKKPIKKMDIKPVSFSKYCATVISHLTNEFQEKDIIQRQKLTFDSNKIIDVFKSEANISELKKNSEKDTTTDQLQNNPSSVKINPEHGKKIAQAYDQMKHEPDHPEVKQAYGALIGETKQQFDDLMGKGLKISRIEPGMENPYKNSKDLHADIKNNNHLWYFPTELGYGDNEQSTSHPMLQPTGIKHQDKELLANDLFRIVHDINGHHVGGESGFGPTGEHQAYLTHKKMYSPLAAKALASETLGQNSWVNFGPHGENNRKNPSQTIYAEQKAGLLPDEIINGNWHMAGDVKKTEKNYSDEELFQFFKEHAMKKTAEYKEKHPETSPEELKKNFNKLLRNGVVLLGLAHAHRYIDTPPDSQQIKDKMIPETSISQEADSGKQKKIDGFLKTTSAIESSGGKNLNHPKISYGMHAGDKAVGQWALMPKTIKELAGRMADNPEIAPYAKMNSKSISKELSQNPHHEKQIASFLANKLYDKFGGDENKMAYAWNQGHNIDPKSFETDRKDYLDHDYVKKYNKYKEENAPARGVASSINK